MRRRIAYPIISCLLLLVLAAPAAARLAPRPALERRLGAALSASQAAPGRSGALAIDLETGEVVFAQNAWTPLAPASNEKLATTYALLTGLGPWFRIETDVLGRGRLDGATWRGNLYLRGHGDPTLDGAGLADLASQLRRAGVSRVTGNLVADASFFDARRGAFGWKAEFFGNESEPLSALTIDRSKAVDPALEAGRAFRGALRGAGVSVAGSTRLGKTTPDAFPLASVLSPPLAEIVHEMDTESDNYLAEMLFKELGAVLLRSGTTPGGAAAATKLLQVGGVPLAGVRLVDGSGLSRLDRLTAEAIVGILQGAYADPLVRPTFLDALPIAGLTGTLEDRMRASPARGNVLAKTGTTNEASALSGFVRRRFAFAILQNGDPVDHDAARASQDRFAQLLAGQ